MTATGSPRPYRKQKRAVKEERTRLRITEAAVELHRTLGPAATGVTDIAKRAGVSRMTVYTHFPTDADLFTACSTHWASQSPFPAPESWAGIDDPRERLVAALKDLYGWYRREQDMMSRVLRDASTAEAVAAALDVIWWPYLEEVVDMLARGWAEERSGAEELAAALRLAVDFDAWRILTGAGLGDGRAAELGARMVAGLSSD